MKRFEIIDLIEDLGFQSLANWLDSNECTHSEAISHIRYERTIQSEEEFPIEIFNQVYDLIDLCFSL